MKANNISQPQRKQTSVVLEGIDTSTPNDIVKDGKCETLMNMRFKDNAWRPVGTYPQKATIPLDNIFSNGRPRIVYQHPAAGEDSYIVEVDREGQYSYYLVYTKDVDNTDITQDRFIGTFDEEMKISHFGNIVLLFNNVGDIFYYAYDGVSKEYSEFIKPEPPILRQQYQKWADRGVTEGGDITKPDDDWIDISNITQSIPPTHYQAELITDKPETIDTKNFKPFKEKWDTNAYVALWRLADNDGNLLISNYAPKADIDGYWWGEIAYFACYRMADGTILAPTPIAICCSEAMPPNSKRQTIRKYNDGYTYLAVYSLARSTASGEIEGVNTPLSNLISPQMQYAVCKATIDIPKNIDKDLITEVCIYSTRLNPIFDIGNTSTIVYDTAMLTKEKTDEVSYYTGRDNNRPVYVYEYNYKGSPTDKSTHFANNKLAEQPFYLIHSIPVSAFTPEGAFSTMRIEVVIDSYMLQGAESKPQYIPNNNIHNITWERNFEFNNRLHIYKTTRKLLDSPAVGPAVQVSTTDKTYENQMKWDYVTDINIYNEQRTTAPQNSSTSLNVDWVGWPYPSLYCASYHDYRAYLTRGVFYDSVTKQVFKQKQIPLTPAMGNNIAYYSNSSDILKYSHIPLDESFDISAGSQYFPEQNNIFTDYNKIMVSSLNNPFSWPFENTYAVGSESSKILALQSAAIEMSDAKFGEMPLYAFTEEGIFALQAGENTLYSSVIPINYDKIINPDVLAINYNLVYITEKGVHILNNQGSVLISSPLNTLDGKPLDVWERVKLLNPQSFNEVICFNAGTQMAYIYNLDLQYWSQRTMQVGNLINKTTGVRIDGSNHLIFDITQEGDNNNQNIMIITRPIKLGDLDFKRLETIIPRMTGDCNIAFNIEASNDCKEWMALRDITVQSIAQPFTLRRTPFSAKYFRFIITSTMSNTPLALTNIDLEWYHKFLRRMR